MAKKKAEAVRLIYGYLPCVSERRGKCIRRVAWNNVECGEKSSFGESHNGRRRQAGK